MKLKAVGLLASMVLAFGAQQASAETITQIYNGTVSQGTDSNGFFGGGSLVGDAFTAIVAFDLSTTLTAINVDATRTTTSTSDSVIAHNGAEFSFGNISFTIDSQTVGLGQELVLSDGVSEFNYLGETLLYYSAVVQGSKYSAQLGAIFASTLSPSLQQSIQSVSSQPATGEFYDGLDSLSLEITSFQVSAVPLPASLPLFGTALLGLAGLGYAMRRGWVEKAGAIAA